jgi:hypothetical protein
VNIGRVVLGFSVVVAVVGAAAFGVTAFGPTQVSIDSGGRLCIPASDSGRAVFGVAVYNDGDQAATIGSIEPRAQEGIASIRVWALPPLSAKNEGGNRPGTAAIPDVSGWSDRRSVENTIVPAHSSVTIAVGPRLAEGVTSGAVHGYVVGYTPASGVSRALRSDVVTAFEPSCG